MLAAAESRRDWLRRIGHVIGEDWLRRRDESCEWVELLTALITAI